MTQTRSASDQRRHTRYPVGITFDVSHSGAPAGRCRAVIADLSEGGMTLKTEAELEEGMTLHLALPNRLGIRGEVRHARGFSGGLRRYGVRFHKIVPATN